ncbi:MAG TPA: ATP cone domain-containing protein [Flavobacterium sp.]|uniref:ATP cone domain-containing protein n=1 Tax=Flavobacterium sp. TaxID=239 RepID=UPI002D1620A1|nr:ATP cone domain-containing protein [Flavobacterium sp.]HNP33536.1 ATP cone domain-containing protein [Flavobacterium sp.]
MKIIKNSGDIVDFSRNKLKRSLLKSGASDSEAEDIVLAVESQLTQGMSTRHIYRMAEKLLKKISAPHAARYNLRTAIQQLGPAGFFFEKFVSLIFASEGYQVRNNLMLQGKCVSHEIDIVIRKNAVTTMIECKFHAKNASISDVKVPMYILSRFNDLKNKTHRIFQNKDTIDDCKIVTNNRFSIDAETFAKCSGIDLLSWDYPKNDSLKTKIDDKALYPITCLTTLTLVEKQKLLIMEIILVKQLIENTEALFTIGISEGRQKNIINEAAGLCKYLIK